MSLAQKLADKVNVPTQEFSMQDVNENVEFAQLSIDGLAQVNKRVDINLWEHILDTFSGNIEEAMDADDPKEAAQQVDQKAMLNFLRGLDYYLQIELAWESLKETLGKETTKEQANKIFSYGLSDDVQMQALMFVLQGVQEEDVEEKVEDDTKNQKDLALEEGG